jgi:2-keto-4-pentenoate hydratase/2-oxohepta-3-ene-1,7-dioic acid hydratase in catechol pathway
MQLTTLVVDGDPRAGVRDGDVVRLLEPSVTLLDIITGGAEALADLARQAGRLPAVPLGEATFGPLLAPPSIRDFLTYERHIAVLAGEVPDAWYEQPFFYFSNPAAVLGAYDPVPMAPGAAEFDYELEVAAVIGAPGADLTPEQAAGHIFGYTIMNDWSARDLQVAEFKTPMGPSKSKDSATTLGPWLVTADELADFTTAGRLALNAEVALNGRRTGGDNTANMSWSFADLVAYASRGTVVRPGDVLGSGTCATGCLAEIRKSLGDKAPGWLKPGDVVRIEVEHLGYTESRLTAAAPVRPVPPARRRLTSGASA